MFCDTCIAFLLICCNFPVFFMGCGSYTVVRGVHICTVSNALLLRRMCRVQCLYCYYMTMWSPFCVNYNWTVSALSDLPIRDHTSKPSSTPFNTFSLSLHSVLSVGRGESLKKFMHAIQYAIACTQIRIRWRSCWFCMCRKQMLICVHWTFCEEWRIY